MPVLPFHRYIGPGNPSDNGPPIDEDDRIAKRHDHSYDSARSEEDVRRADLEAIGSFRRDWVVRKNWHSLIGDLGLSAKYFVESFTGVMYPDLEDEEDCRTLLVAHFLRLHCHSKPKPLLEKYRYNPFREGTLAQEIPKVFPHSHEDYVSLIPPFLYVPINWSDIYLLSQRDDIVINKFGGILKQSTLNRNVSKDSMKIITKYLEMLFLFNRKRTDKTDRPDLLDLINSGEAFIDQDGYVISENIEI